MPDFSRRSFISVADAVFQIVTADEVSAGPPIDRRVEPFQEFQRVGTHPLNVVGRHQGNATDGNASGAFCQDDELSFCIFAAGKFKVVAVKVADLDGNRRIDE
jgi:hypothetical protein